MKNAFLKQLTLIIIIPVATGFCYAFKFHHKESQAIHKTNDAVSIEAFGAKANDDNFDNAPAIIKALNSNANILIPANKTFTIRSTIQVSGLSSCTITASNSTIINRNYDARTFLFTNCSDIKIIGGTYTRDTLPTVQNGKNQSTIGFAKCKNVVVTQVHIDRSPEMGIDNNIVIGGTYSYNTIEHCLRDGIYAHYSANLEYTGNNLNEIKDDALSMHDYGIAAQKTMLHEAGYQQAGHSKISGNVIQNCVQGISSIACTDLIISNNRIKNVANAGICVFNSENLYPNSNARVNNVKIEHNLLSNTGYSITVNGIKINNSAQNASGRASIFVACHRQGQSFTTSQMRSSNVTVVNNTVNNSAVNGATMYDIDGLLFANNHFNNCHSDTQNAPGQTGDIVEILNCTGINVYANDVIDSRSAPLHNRAYRIENSSGTLKKGIDKGYKIEESSLKNSKIN